MVGFKLFLRAKRDKKDNNLDTIELDLSQTTDSKLNSSLCTPSVYIKARQSRRPSSVYISPKERCSFFPLALFSLAMGKCAHSLPTSWPLLSFAKTSCNRALKFRAVLLSLIQPKYMGRRNECILLLQTKCLPLFMLFSVRLARRRLGFPPSSTRKSQLLY